MREDAEKKIWEPGWRYRKVTDPAGMENWFKPAFDAKQAGWKTGHAPFGQLDGKLPAEHWSTCQQPYCRCGEPLKTLWDKEVLLLRSKLNLQVTRGLSLRLVLQYNGFRDQWEADPLLQYQWNPLSIFYVGSTRDYRLVTPAGQDHDSWRLTDRQYFLKFQYLIRI
mgnify:CR=1 FL=1